MKKIEKNLFASLFILMGILPLIALSLFLIKPAKKPEINILEVGRPTRSLILLSPTPTLIKINVSVSPTPSRPKILTCMDLCKSKGLTTKYAACGVGQRTNSTFWCGPASDPIRSKLCYYNIKNLGNPLIGYSSSNQPMNVCDPGAECYCYDRVSCGNSNQECNARCGALGCGPVVRDLKSIPTGGVNPPIPLP